MKIIAETEDVTLTECVVCDKMVYIAKRRINEGGGYFVPGPSYDSELFCSCNKRADTNENEPECREECFHKFVRIEDEYKKFDENDVRSVRLGIPLFNRLLARQYQCPNCGEIKRWKV